MLVFASGEKMSNICLPNRYKDQDYVQSKIDKLEQKSLDETIKPFRPSGHAFVCFDSIKSVNIVLNHFRMSPWKYAKLFCLHLRDKIR